MSTDLISQLQQSSQLVTKGLNEDTLAVAGGAGSSSKRISIKGGVFRKYVNGKEMGAIDERFMDVIFVRMAHNPHRIFYASSYKEGEKVTPSCWSSDSRVPDKEVKEPQAPACNQCPHSIKGANPGCRLHWRTAVVLPNDPKEVMQLVIPGKSCWGSEEAGRRPFQPYVRYLASNGISNNVVVTRMQFDTAVQHPRILFQATGAVSPEVIPVIEEVGQSTAAENYIKLSVYQPEEDLLKIEAPQAAVAPTPTQTTPTAPVTDVAEPVLRESTVAQPQAPKADVSSIINKWSVKS
jgi:hypothetical protein